jgi:hypothetical protein
MAGMVRGGNYVGCSTQDTERSDRTTEEAQGGKAVGVDPSLITAGKFAYRG